VSKTGFVIFETNRYSVPTEYCGKVCHILAYPDQLQIAISGNRIATHPRCFGVNQKKENPLHREKLLNMTPNFKYQRIYQLVKRMDRDLSFFLQRAEDEGQDPINIAYELFQLLKIVSKSMLLSAIRQANDHKVYKLKLIYSLLQAPGNNPVYPQDQKLLKIDYQKRNLKDYDEFI